MSWMAIENEAGCDPDIPDRIIALVWENFGGLKPNTYGINKPGKKLQVFSESGELLAEYDWNEREDAK